VRSGAEHDRKCASRLAASGRHGERKVVRRSRDRSAPLTKTKQFDNYRTMSNRTTPAALSAAQFTAIAKALADPRRVALLEAIGRKDDCPCQSLCQNFPVSKATISHHLRELTRAGLVESHREGQFLHCQIRRDVLEAYTEQLLRRVGAGG
jgi:ArsR family transcriptional regulator